MTIQSAGTSNTQGNTNLIMNTAFRRDRLSESMRGFHNFYRSVELKYADTHDTPRWQLSIVDSGHLGDPSKKNLVVESVTINFDMIQRPTLIYQQRAFSRQKGFENGGEWHGPILGVSDEELPIRTPLNASSSVTHRFVTGLNFLTRESIEQLSQSACFQIDLSGSFSHITETAATNPQFDKALRSGSGVLSITENRSEVLDADRRVEAYSVIKQFTEGINKLVGYVPSL